MSLICKLQRNHIALSVLDHSGTSRKSDRFEGPSKAMLRLIHTSLRSSDGSYIVSFLTVILWDFENRAGCLEADPWLKNRMGRQSSVQCPVMRPGLPGGRAAWLAAAQFLPASAEDLFFPSLLGGAICAGLPCQTPSPILASPPPLRTSSQVEVFVK